MAYSHEEAATTTAKEIILKLLEHPNTMLLSQHGNYPDGSALAAHLGDCYEALLKKVMHAVKEA